MFYPAITENEVTGFYDFGLVFLSYIIAVIASFTALNLSLRIGESFGLARKVWIAGCAFAMGCGIWSMHFTAMLAYKLPFEVTYNIGITLLSLVISVFASGCGLFLANIKQSSKTNIAWGGLVMGVGVACMHYSGMMAMELNGSMHFHLGLFILSVLIAVIAATAALWLIIHFSKKQPDLNVNLKWVAAFIMGLAIAGMHFTGMAATFFVPQGTIFAGYQTTADLRLFAFGISTVTILIFGLTIAASITQKEFNLLKGVKNELEVRVAERTKELEGLSTFPSENPYPVFRISRDNTIVYSNPPGLSVLKIWKEKVGGKIPSPFLKSISEAELYKTPQKMELQLGHQAFEFSIIYIEEMDYLNIYGRNITEQKLAEAKLENYTKELKRSNNALQEFASMASHDLQEPLRKIYIFGDQIKNGISNLDERSEEYLNRMQRSAKRMQSLILDLLKYSQVNTKAEPFRKTNLRKIVDDAIDILEKRFSETQGTICVENLPTLEAEAFQMRELFQNLIGNALKYHREGVPPDIKIKSSETFKGNIEITVEDNGIGFEQKYKDKIFMPFQRLHGRSAFEGTGMGLSICKRIVEHHGGNIDALSTFGKGSKFIISLPNKSPSSAHDEPKPALTSQNISV